MRIGWTLLVQVQYIHVFSVPAHFPGGAVAYHTSSNEAGSNACYELRGGDAIDEAKR